MRHFGFILLFLAFAGFALLNQPAYAQGNQQQRQSGDFLERHPKSGCYRRDGEHRCQQKDGVGGYSYDYRDGIVLDVEPKNQTGPFDSGFFFDTTSMESQYLNN